MSEPCRADANRDQRSSPNGQQLPRPEQPLLSLPGAMVELLHELRQTNQLLATLLEQNQALIEMVMDSDDGDEQPSVDLEGRPIRVR